MIVYVRFTPESGHRSGHSRRRLFANAQRKSVLDYLDGGRWELVDEFTEVESGKRSDRPALEKALAACKRHTAKLVIGGHR